MKEQATKSYLSYSVAPESHLMRSHWLTGNDSNGYREGMLQLCEQVSRQKIVRLLYHVSSYYSPDASDQKWLLEEFFPLLAQTRLRRIAVVVTWDVFLQTVAEELCRKSIDVFEGSIRMKTFHDAQSAEAWLLAGG